MLKGDTRIARRRRPRPWPPPSGRRNLRRPSERAYPRTARVVVFVGVHLSIDRQHLCTLSAICIAKPAWLVGRRVCRVGLVFKRSASTNGPQILHPAGQCSLGPNAEQADYFTHFRSVVNKTGIVIQ